MNFGRKKAAGKSAGRRRNGEIAAAGKANDDDLALPRLEFEMALEIVGSEDENWTAAVREAAEAAGGDLLFVLPCATDIQAADGGLPAGASPVENAMVRLVEDGESRLLLVRSGAAGLHLVEEDAIDAELIRFARASIDVLERLGADKRVVAPLATAVSH